MSQREVISWLTEHGPATASEIAAGLKANRITILRNLRDARKNGQVRVAGKIRPRRGCKFRSIFSAADASSEVMEP